MINEIGWIGNGFFIIGAMFLTHKNINGWYCNLFGNLCYIIQGFLIGLNSLWAISVFLLLINLYGIINWKKGKNNE